MAEFLPFVLLSVLVSIYLIILVRMEEVEPDRMVCIACCYLLTIFIVYSMLIASLLKHDTVYVETVYIR